MLTPDHCRRVAQLAVREIVLPCAERLLARGAAQRGQGRHGFTT